MRAPRPIIGRTGRVSRPSERDKDHAITSYDNLPYVEAALNHLAPMTERPRYYAHVSEPGVPRSNIAHEERRMRDLLARDAEELLRGRVQVINL
jgi:hypothetical protein